MQTFVSQFMSTLKDYPQRQKSASFNHDQVLDKLSDREK